MTSKNPAALPVSVWGLPLSPLSLAATVEAVAALVERGVPSYFVTANTHYAMLTEQFADLRGINERAAFLVADGAPLVWAARRRSVPLPERVAGSDLIFAICDLAARRSYRVFLAGGAPGVAEEASRKLTSRYPGLQIVGQASPSFRDGCAEEYERLKVQVGEARPHILIVAATMPHGERWLAAHVEDLGVPLGVNLGAAIDFAAGRIHRAPRWMQRSGLEWAFRLSLEPRRLFSRYSRNALFLLRRVYSDVIHASPEGKRSRSPRLANLAETPRETQ